MKKPKSKLKLLFILLFVVAVIVASYFLIRIINRPANCVNIIGDGYSMGLDPEPVVIGNTCDP